MAWSVEFDAMPTQELQQRYDGLIHELRCMQCQNESIADSPVDLAADKQCGRFVYTDIHVSSGDKIDVPFPNGCITTGARRSRRGAMRGTPKCGRRATRNSTRGTATTRRRSCAIARATRPFDAEANRQCLP
jgi:hypothetical protein